MVANFSRARNLAERRKAVFKHGKHTVSFSAVGDLEFHKGGFLRPTRLLVGNTLTFGLKTYPLRNKNASPTTTNVIMIAQAILNTYFPNKGMGITRHYTSSV